MNTFTFDIFNNIGILCNIVLCRYNDIPFKEKNNDKPSVLSAEVKELEPLKFIT